MVVRAERPRADVVTLGKRMGNGYPVAALVTWQELLDRLNPSTEVFSIFGGNPSPRGRRSLSST